ncbi:cytochrome P450 [Podospora didyma]|uniref:Cytochrome P450 n=1 Tax=Podospora didyma TaxID=330526 RepID=A0AAE0U217_9PEZI|nr:cytochrome P450 [Podospora didyma]
MFLLLAGLLFLAPVWWLASSAWCLARNIQAARASGLPYLVLPLNPDNPLYMIFSVPLWPFVERFLPGSLHDAVLATIYGWEFLEKSSLFHRIGPVFILVTTGLNRVMCGDAAMTSQVMARRNVFTQHSISKTMMGVFGGNVLVADGDDWSRQRRIVAPSLNERISPTVWRESIDQATQMVRSMLALPGGETRGSVHGIRAIAINVIGRVAYGDPKPWLKPIEFPTDPDADMSYTDVVGLMTELIIVAALVPIRILRLSVMPRLLQTLGAAMEKMPRQTKDMLDYERHRAGDGHPDTITSRLVRLSDQAKLVDHDKTASKQYLTEEEISGNLFLFTTAGFDTTAFTMGYALGLLAAYPEWQRWIQAELDQVLGDDAQPEYTDVFPKLTRCLAFMLETLRLFTPILHLPRDVLSSGTTLTTTSGTAHEIVGPCIVYLVSTYLHTNPADWGDDGDAFRPTRWLNPSPKEGEPPIITPAPGTFIAWSGGPRQCPGLKMSQVEFVAVISTILRTCSIEPVTKDGETMDQARQRLLDVMQDSQPTTTLRMKRPEDIHLRWVKR